MWEEVLSACYQASLLREEEQPVTFRLALCGPEVFPAEEGPPNGLHCLEFSDPRPFDAQELRRLSSATDYPRSIVGARYDGTQGLRIWGLVHTGPRWLRDRRGGRVIGPPLPPLPIVHVTGPGRLEVRKGSGVVARLENGALADASMDVFESEWLPAGFATVRAELMELHLAARERARERDGELWAPLDPDLARKISQQIFKRLISTVQNFGRGGTVIFVPPERTEEFYAKNRFVALKYRFAEGEPRRRFRTLIVRTMNRLAQAHGSANSTSLDEVQDPSAVGWTEYQESTLLDQVKGLQSRAYAILDKAEEAGELRTALSAIREARGNLELLAKLLGELDERPVVNLNVSPEWLELRAVIVGALELHPDARESVLRAIESAGDDRRA